jgi:hypothetical protein
MRKLMNRLLDRWCVMRVNHWVRSHREKQHPAEAEVMTSWRSKCCRDWRLRQWSVQASEFHYCEPRENNAFPYTKFEVNPPHQLWDMKTDDVVAYAPAREVYYAVLTGRLPKQWGEQKSRLAEGMYA